MTPAESRDTRTIDERLSDPGLITRALARAVADALRMHKRMGNPICTLRDGRVVWIPPEEIPDLPVEDEPAGA